MKGKGKVVQDKDCPLQFPDLLPVDHVKECLKYTAILARSEDETVSLDEVNQLQTDIETLLANAGKRLKLLEGEIQLLVNWQDKKDKKGIVTPSEPVPGKRGKGAADDKPNKKLKDSSGKASQLTPPPPSRPKSKNMQNKVLDYDFVDSPVELPKLPKNDAVNRFWTSVEPYCAELTNDDLKVLDDLLKAHENDSESFKIPPLGKHYSEKWAEEDMLEEQREGAKINDKRKNSNHSNSSLGMHDATTLLKKAESISMEDSPFGPLTQRLVAALIEENIMAHIDDSMNENGGKDSADEAPAISPRTLAKQLNIGNPIHLEKRIKKELEEQGIIDVEDQPEDDPDDEILAEIKEKQQELRALHERNIGVIKQLIKKAKEEMSRQEMRKKLVAADSEVMEAYRKIQAARQKKKTPTKKEKDAAWKAIKERDAIIKTLEL
ncbi:transcriptional adapter 3-like isoform X2 [Gigantopelta aegis]|uniref:transcriptional adapter 3-like isoform X2 n=1 Tax=Gigantopelta aegis TaxID=1735272 RepID=UPI001B889EA8|nr:transcriptional adapter 3-like isoform X2 [Gigantopelta aegis]